MPKIDLVSSDIVAIAAGEGSITPTAEFADQDVIGAIRETQVAVEDRHIVCVDEREAATGSEPARRKTAGGPTITGYGAVIMNGGYSLLTDEQRKGGPLLWYELVVDQQVRSEVPIAGHTDNHASDDDPSCGAAKKLPRAIELAGEFGEDPALVGLAEAVLGDGFDKARWEKAVAGAKEIAHAGLLSGWDPGRLIRALKSHRAPIEVLNGDKDALKDPDNLRHNHWGEAVNINLVAGKTNNRDAARIPYFQLDGEAVQESVRPLATSEGEYLDLMHAAVLFNFGVVLALTSKQRIVLTRP